MNIIFGFLTWIIVKRKVIMEKIIKFFDFCSGIGVDNGRKTANMLQFKIDPTEIFNIEEK